jgi:hypothetical protein
VLTLGSHIDAITYRVVEILIIIFLSLIQMTVTHEKTKYQQSSYTRIIFLLDIFYFLSFLDIMLGLIFNHFPYLNFLLRPFIIIFQKKNLRREWLKIFRITYMTKSLAFILTFIIIVFSLIGHLLLSQDNNEFSSFFTSLDTMFIVLTTCNFPDIMLKTFPISKFCIIFFVSYLLINFFVFLSLLKALYYVSYIELNKEKAEFTIERLKKNRYLIESKAELKKKLVELNNKFLFSREEYKRLKELLGVGVVESNNKFLKRMSTINFFSQSEDDMMKVLQHDVLRILRLKKTETIVNVINLIVIGLVFIKKKNLVNDIIQMGVCLYFIIEFFIYVKYYTLKKMVLNKMLRFCFFLLSAFSFIILLAIFLLEIFDAKIYIDDLINLIRPLIIFRAIRLLMLLSSFDEYKTIFTTLRNMKPMFYNMMATQFSFFVIFSTISMVMLGGKVKVDQYKNDPNIPEYYTHLNFNCFPSAFLTCFTLIMMNNMNVVTDALAQPVGVFLKAYFCLFFFLGIINLLNLCQTYIMEMYVVTKKSKKSED